MIRRLNPLLIIAIVVACINGALLFVVIPRITDRVALLYGQDRFIDGYDQIATNLVRGNGYRFYPDTAKTMMREPGYPIFLAGLMLAFGSAFTEVKLANMVLALATAWLTMCLAGRISKNRVVLIVSP